MQRIALYKLRLRDYKHVLIREPRRSRPLAERTEDVARPNTPWRSASTTLPIQTWHKTRPVIAAVLPAECRRASLLRRLLTLFETRRCNRAAVSPAPRRVHQAVHTRCLPPSIKVQDFYRRSCRVHRPPPGRATPEKPLVRPAWRGSRPSRHPYRLDGPPAGRVRSGQ